MIRSRIFVVGLVLLCIVGASGFAGPSSAFAQQPAPQTATTVDSCTKITNPGRYVLTHDIHNGKAAISTGCVKIRANDVVFDGQGHTLDGFGVSDTSGVNVDGASNVTVRNFRANDWDHGVYVEDASGVTVRDVVTVNNAIGIEVSGSNTRLDNNTVRGNLRGVVLADSWDDTLVGNRIHHNRAIDIYAPVALVHGFGLQLSVGPPLDPDDYGRYEDMTGKRGNRRLGRGGVPGRRRGRHGRTGTYAGTTAIRARFRRRRELRRDGRAGLRRTHAFRMTSFAQSGHSLRSFP